MSKPYDATLKHLVDLFADDWAVFLCQRLQLPPGTQAQPLDADLSTASPQADKLFRLSGPVQGFIHVELQASWAGDLPAKLLVYNVLAEDRYGGPMRSVIVLLRPEADAPGVTGTLTRADEAGEYLRLRYHVLRLWEMPSQPLLQGPLGTLPLALLTDDARPQLLYLVERVQQRLQQECVSGKIAGEIWTASEILLGLRYDKEEIHRIFQGVAGMEESVIYQEILEKGIAKGRREALIADRQTVLLEFGPDRLGIASAEIQSEIQAIRDVDRLVRMRNRLRQATDWQDLLRTP